MPQRKNEICVQYRRGFLKNSDHNYAHRLGKLYIERCIHIFIYVLTWFVPVDPVCQDVAVSIGLRLLPDHERLLVRDLSHVRTARAARVI